MVEPGNLTHPEASGDTDYPIFYNLPAFLRRCFACYPYDCEGGGYPQKSYVKWDSMFNIALYCENLNVLLLVTTLCKMVCNKVM